MDDLTPAQREIMKLIGFGFSDAQIARIRGTKLQTQRNHVKDILSALGVKARVSVAVYYLTGWLPPYAYARRVVSFHSRPSVFDLLDREAKEIQDNVFTR